MAGPQAVTSNTAVRRASPTQRMLKRVIPFSSNCNSREMVLLFISPLLVHSFGRGLVSWFVQLLAALVFLGLIALLLFTLEGNEVHFHITPAE